MSVSVEKLENSMAVLTIEVSVEDFDKAVERVYRRQKSRLTAPGFRKGKISRKIAERLYGAEIFFDDAASDTVNSTYPDAVRESGEDVVSSPEIKVVQLEAGKPFIYSATVALKPPVTLGQYKGIEVEKPEVTVTDEEVDKEIEDERQKNASVNEVTDRPVKDGDMITLDFDGSVDGVPFDGGKGDNYPLTIGSHSFIPGFEEQLIGANIGEDVEVNVTFPEDYQAKDLQGKAAVFKCKVNSIREKILPELNDEFADDVSEFSTLEEYKEDVRKKLEVQKEEAANTEKENKVIDAIVANATMEIPDAMLRTQENQMIDEFAQRLQQQGMLIDDYYKYLDTNREAMMEDVKPQALRRIQTRLVLEQIVKEENIVPTDEDYEEELKKLADSYGADLETIKNIFAGEEKENLMQDIAVQKAVTFVTEQAIEVEKAPEEKAEEKASDETPAEEGEKDSAENTDAE